MIFTFLWNAADNDVGVAGGHIDGSTLVGGPSASYAADMAPDELNHALSSVGSSLHLGVGYGATGGHGVHQGAGWDSKGSVTCHSYGCAVNFAKAPKKGMVAAFK